MSITRPIVQFAIVSIVAAASLVMCAGCSSNSSVEARGTTTGQELQDLQTAYDKGLMTESEYQKKRKQILDRK